MGFELGLDINKIINSLSQLKKIDFSDSDGLFAILAEKYDKNKNSIFDTDEIQQIKNDLSIFAVSEDDNANNLSEKESVNFITSITTAKNIIDKSSKDILDYVSNLFNKLTVSGREQDLEAFINENGWQDRYLFFRTDEISDLNPEQYARLKELLSFKKDDNFLREYEIVSLSSLDENRYNKAMYYFQNGYKDYQFDSYQAIKFSELNEEEFNSAIEMLNDENLMKHFVSFCTVCELVKLSSEELAKAKEMLYIKNHQFLAEEILELVSLSDNQRERAKNLLETEKYSTGEIVCLARLSEEEFERAQQLMNIEGGKFTGSDIAECARLSEDEFERAKNLLYIEGRTKQLRLLSAIDLAKLSDKEFERVKQLVYIEGRDYQLDSFGIRELVQLEEEQYNRALELLTYSHKGEQLESYDIKTLSVFSEEQFQRLLNVFENNKILIIDHLKDMNDITNLSYLKPEDLSRLKYLLDIEIKRDGDNLYSNDDLSELLSLSEDKFERVKEFLYIENKKGEQFSAGEILGLLDLSDEELNRAKNLGLMSSEATESDIKFMLRCLTDEEINWVSEYVLPCIQDILNEEIISLVKNRNPEIEELIKQNPNKAIIRYKDSTTIMTIDNNVYYFDKDGIFETCIEENVEVENYKDCKRYVIENKRLNIRQEIIRGTLENGHEDIVIQEKITYFDDNGNITKIVNIKRTENGTLNVSETNNSEETTPVQWESFEPNGSRIIERHFTTPDGTKTDIYNEESENLKIMEYKITGLSGNAIVQLNTTFQKIDDNTYISSINATGKEEDTQVYEIKYNDDYTIVIYDRKNSEETTIDLKQFFNNDDSAEKLLPVIKQLPGHVLLEFAEKGFILNYNEEDIQNGSWNKKSKVIEVGNYTTMNNNENIENEGLLGTLTHELGHYLDLYRSEQGEFSYNEEILSIFNEEYEIFKNTTTYTQQKHVSYLSEFDKTLGIIQRNDPNHERVAETHAIMNSTNHEQTNLRRYYFAKYFPRTIAAIMKVLLNEEGVKTN